MKLQRISKSLVSFVTVFSMVMPSVALIAASDEVWAGSDCDKVVQNCNDEKNDPSQIPTCGSAVSTPSGSMCLNANLLGDNAAQCKTELNKVADDCNTMKKQCATACDKKGKAACEKALDAVVKQLQGEATTLGSTVDPGAGKTASASCVDDGDMSTAAHGGGGGDDSTVKPGGGDNPGTSPGNSPGTSPGTSPGARPSNAGTGGGGGMGALSSLLPLAAMAAMMMANKKNNNNNNNSSNVAVNGYASPDGVVDATGKVNCGATYAYRYSYCNAQVSQACIANITTMAGSQVCEQFSARYCNQGYSAPSFYSQCPYPYTAGETCGTSYFTTPSPTSATQVDIIGEGVGSGYCLRATQIAFCSSASNAQCPSCLQLQSLQSTACVNNPSLCNVVNTSTTSASQVAACPAMDPLVAAGIISAPATVVAGTTTTPNTLPVNAPPAVLPLASASTASAGGLQVASAINGISARSPASAGDVAPEYGTSLFNAGSTPLSQRCNAGLFNHCIRN